VGSHVRVDEIPSSKEDTEQLRLWVAAGGRRRRSVVDAIVAEHSWIIFFPNKIGADLGLDVFVGFSLCVFDFCYISPL
jgi:hypothetical protein